MSGTSQQGLRVAITGGTSGLGLALVRELDDTGRAHCLHRAEPRGRGARSPASNRLPLASSGTSLARRISIRSRYRCLAHSAASTCSSTTPRRLALCRSFLLADTECEDLELRARDKPRGSVPPDEGAPRVACRISARRTAAARGERVERRSRHRVCRAGAPTAPARLHSIISAGSGTRSSPQKAFGSSPSIPGTWTRRCTRSRSLMPIARR